AVVVLYVRTQEPFEQGNTGLLHHMIHTARVAKMPFAEDCHFVGRQRGGTGEKLEYRRRASRQSVADGGYPCVVAIQSAQQRSACGRAKRRSPDVVKHDSPCSECAQRGCRNLALAG